jgi:hypothetical protein
MEVGDQVLARERVVAEEESLLLWEGRSLICRARRGIVLNEDGEGERATCNNESGRGISSRSEKEKRTGNSFGEPSPTLLVAQASPPIITASSLTMRRPSPLPPCDLVMLASTWLNGLKSRF